MLRFMPSERDEKGILCYNGHQFTKKRTNKGSQEWRCRDRKCCSTLSLCISGTTILRQPGTHTCTPVPDTTTIVEEAVSLMKTRARKETTSITKIYSQEVVKTRLENPDISTGLCFPPLPSLNSSLYHQRMKNFPRLPNWLADLSLPYEWTLTKQCQHFLLIDESCKLHAMVDCPLLNIFPIRR